MKGDDVEFRTIGNSDLKVSALGLGCNNFGGRLDIEGSKKVIAHALNLGITLFDTADVYPMGKFGVSEKIIGDSLGERRKDVVLVTKFGYPMDDPERKPGGSRAYVVSAVEESLARLKTDWIDLYLYHKPDPHTPLEETIRAMDDLIRTGKVRYVGCSNFSAEQVTDAVRIAEELGASAIVCAQEQYSLLARGIEKAVIPALKAHDIGLLPFFPLASGLLTGKYRKGAPMPEGARLTKAKPLADMFMTDENLDAVESLAGFAEQHDHQLIDLAFSWLLAQEPVASVIAGATSAAQLDANLSAITWKLSDAELAEVDRLT
jgi:aryl-alcohol dehydrogenase-like predicted oxidoreductase